MGGCLFKIYYYEKKLNLMEIILKKNIKNTCTIKNKVVYLYYNKKLGGG